MHTGRLPHQDRTQYASFGLGVKMLVPDSEANPELLLLDLLKLLDAVLQKPVTDLNRQTITAS